MASELPDAIDCRALAATRVLAGTVDPARLGRLASAFTVTAPVTAALELVPDGDGRIRISGRLDVGLAGTCQRCLEPLTLALTATVEVLALAAAERLRAEDDEWIEAPAGHLDLVALVEDELLLASPMIASHPEGACGAAAATAIGGEATGDTRRPFAGLKDLLQQPR